MGLPQDQGVLQGEARPGVSGGGHEVGSEGRDDQRAHDDLSLYERAAGLSEVLHGAELYLFRSSEVSYQSLQLTPKISPSDLSDQGSHY